MSKQSEETANKAKTLSSRIGEHGVRLEREAERNKHISQMYRALAATLDPRNVQSWFLTGSYESDEGVSKPFGPIVLSRDVVMEALKRMLAAEGQEVP